MINDITSVDELRYLMTIVDYLYSKKQIINVPHHYTAKNKSQNLNI